MKTRAAVAFEASKPLEIVELHLEGPKAGEVLVEIIATGVCHTDSHTLDGKDSEGCSRRCWGTRARALCGRLDTGWVSNPGAARSWATRSYAFACSSSLENFGAHVSRYRATQ